MAQLARMIGYTNVSKGYRKIDVFERTGHVHPVLLDKLAAALGIDRRTRSRLAYEDYKAVARRHRQSPDTVHDPTTVSGAASRVPEGLKTVEEMEQYAADYARRHGAAVTLVLGNRIRVTFAEDGSLNEIVEALPPENTDMKIHGLPDQFWVVTRPSEFSTSEDILFPCTFDRLMLQARGGLQEDEIVGIFADEDEARRAAATAAGRLSRPSPGRGVRRGRRPCHGHPEGRGDDRQGAGEGGGRGGRRCRPPGRESRLPASPEGPDLPGDERGGGAEEPHDRLRLSCIAKQRRQGARR